MTTDESLGISLIDDDGTAPARKTRKRPRLWYWPAAWLRMRFWRTVFFWLGGITIRGRLPKGGCVVVANHSSHADAAALVTAIKARRAPRVAAASDYWFKNPFRRVVCSLLIGALPVRRHDGGGGYTDLVGNAVPLLRAGHAVVIFPEGTRSGEISKFHQGAFRLAETAGVPVVPVAVSGTGELLPKGRFVKPRAVAPEALRGVRTCPVAEFSFCQGVENVRELQVQSLGIDGLQIMIDESGGLGIPLLVSGQQPDEKLDLRAILGRRDTERLIAALGVAVQIRDQRDRDRGEPEVRCLDHGVGGLDLHRQRLDGRVAQMRLKRVTH